MEEITIDWKKVLKVIIWVIVGAIVISLAWWGFSVLFAKPYGAGEMYKQIQSAEYRREAYEYFYNQYASIKSLEGKIDVFTKQLATMEKGTREYNMILTNISGVQGLRHDAIQQYNATARKEYAAGQFRAPDLPYQIPDIEYPLEGGNK